MWGFQAHQSKGILKGVNTVGPWVNCTIENVFVCELVWAASDNTLFVCVCEKVNSKVIIGEFYRQLFCFVPLSEFPSPFPINTQTTLIGVIFLDCLRTTGPGSMGIWLTKCDNIIIIHLVLSYLQAPEHRERAFDGSKLPNSASCPSPPRHSASCPSPFCFHYDVVTLEDPISVGKC